VLIKRMKEDVDDKDERKTTRENVDDKDEREC